ncbi:MAG: sugar phosphate isomerase/epimerase [Clostridia bacterium]|nr:sugar phosphate isomerase/epimerase [Clostridia bacterium]
MAKIQVGISTASLFKRMYTEEAVEFFSLHGVPVCETFLETYREYKTPFAEIVKKAAGDMRVHSVHTLNTHFEPQLFSANDRSREDAFEIAEDVLRCAGVLGAKCYTFHGLARIKDKNGFNDFPSLGASYTEICRLCAKYGVSLALENVAWGHYNHVGFFSGVKKYCPELKGTLDIKQARAAGEGYDAYLKEMGSDIVTLHASDVDYSGKLCLPGRGVTDFSELFRKLADAGFRGAVILEVYAENFTRDEELFASCDYLKDLAEKIF